MPFLNPNKNPVFLNPIKMSYDDGLCPDCNLEIPDDVVEGQECQNCGHVFNEEMPCEREIEDDGTWTCIYDHTGCLWNDSNNGCSHGGDSLRPLEVVND